MLLHTSPGDLKGNIVGGVILDPGFGERGDLESQQDSAPKLLCALVQVTSLPRPVSPLVN